MTQPPDSPERRRNRIGCIVIAAVIALFVALAMLAGFNADPGNSAAEDIPALPTGDSRRSGGSPGGR